MPQKSVTRKTEFLALASSEKDIQLRAQKIDFIEAIFYPLTCADYFNESTEKYEYDKKAITIAEYVKMTLIGLIGKWRLFVGAMKDVSDTQMEYEAKFIARTYPTLTVKEIELMIDMYISGKLNVVSREKEYNHYINFSARFITETISLFQQLKHKQVSEVIEKQPPPDQKPTPEQNRDAMIWMIKHVLVQIKEKVLYVTLVRDVFEYLLKWGFIKPDKETDLKAQEFINKKVNSTPKKEDNEVKGIGAVLKPVNNRETLIRNIYYEYYVRVFFNANKPSEFIKLMDVKHFVNDQK